MDADKILTLLLQASQLKITPRMGWQVRGVPEPESVADHTYLVGILVLVLADLIDEPVQRDRVLAMALVHDLGEAILTDLPWPASRLLPPGVKHAAERRALAHIIANAPVPESFHELWEDYRAGESVESRLIHDADAFEVLLQAYLYERAGSRNLGEFWAARDEHVFIFPVTRQLFTSLLERRDALWVSPPDLWPPVSMHQNGSKPAAALDHAAPVEPGSHDEEPRPAKTKGGGKPSPSR